MDSEGGLLLGCSAGRDVGLLAGSFCPDDEMAGFCVEACIMTFSKIMIRLALDGRKNKLLS